MASEASVSKLNKKTGAEQKSGPRISEEQLVYGNLLGVTMKIGLVAIVLSFLVYVTGIMPPKIAINDVISNWGDTQVATAQADSSSSGSASSSASKSSSANDKKTSYDILLEENGVHHGWSWVSLFGYGDFINMFPIAFLASITIFCYIAIIPTLLKKRDTIYATLAIIEVLILVGAASGLISGGH
jgi:hypothetical protein